LASGAWDGDARLWSVETGRDRNSPLKGHRSGVYVVSFSSDGKTLITFSDDRTMRWWSVATGKEMLLFENVLISRYAGSQSLLNPGGNIVLWQEYEGPIRSTRLPTLAEIDAAKQAEASQQREP